MAKIGKNVTKQTNLQKMTKISLNLQPNLGRFASLRGTKQSSKPILLWIASSFLLAMTQSSSESTIKHFND